VEVDVQRAATLDAGRGFFVAEVHRHGDPHHLMRVDPVEIEVDRLVGDGMELHVLGDDRLGLVAVLQGHEVAEQLARKERLAELVGLHCDSDRILAPP